MDLVLSLKSEKRSPQWPHLFLCFPFHLLSDPYLLQAGVSSPALCIKLCRSPSVLILGGFGNLTSQQAWTPHTTPQDALLLLQGEQLSDRGVSGSARPPAGPGPTLLQASALPGTKGPK